MLLIVIVALFIVPQSSSFKPPSIIILKGMNVRIDEDDEVSVRHCCIWFFERYFTKEKLKRRFPIASWFPQYTFHHFRGDFIAGLSVAFTIIPQALALATLAGLPPNYGLYSSFMGCFIYSIFGTTPSAAIGPTSILAIIVAPYVLIGGETYAILLSFFSGLLMLLLGLLNCGFLVDFISYPVIASFSCAAALTIAVSQLKGFFGLHYAAAGFRQTITAVFHNIKLVNFWDLGMGFFCLLFLIPLQMSKEIEFDFRGHPFLSVIANSLVWLLVTGRNALVVIISTAVAYLTAGHTGFSLTNEITTGLPDFRIPDFVLKTNETHVVKDLPNVFSDITAGVCILVLIELMETVAVAKSFNAGKKLDSTQEMIALGLSNLMGSFVSAFPVSGSFSRSAVNYCSGVKTPLGGVVTGLLVLLALATLAPFFQLIPQTALSSIIIAAVLPMMKIGDIWIIWNSNKVDLVPYTLTFAACLFFGLEIGIVVGVNVSLGILLYQMARPRIAIVLRMTPEGHQFLYVKPDRSVFFPSVEYMKVKIDKALIEVSTNEVRTLVIDGEHMFRSDSTFGMVNLFITHLSLLLLLMTFLFLFFFSP